ncbi:putative Ribosome-binding ATPase YchF [Blattamonas nauphoetae]|uniref:Obg-like ATPase 1 n=1 Tax=Blattamonas nauphoetae TaxID=2049346 RepID=A0ABQ9YLW1_9EUKA|nr:putative Ribosome-binding ATPase YchF [Blattamonas nauphoetae]
MSRKEKNPPPPKKAQFGRVSNNLQMGIVGLANVGKSTFFNALTKSEVPAENYPFCTIDPTTARAQVPDARWEYLCEVYKPQRSIPAFLSVTDIAGLIKGASEGLGLGNNFLSHIQAVDGIFHMIRIFQDEDITHVEGSVDPSRDLDIVSNELRLKDIEILAKKVDGLVRINARTNDKTKKFELDTVNKCIHMLQEEGRDLRFGDWDAHEIDLINTWSLLTTKPVVFLINMNRDAFIQKKGGKHLLAVKNWVDQHCPGEMIIPLSAQLERELIDMPPEESAAFLKEHSLGKTLDKIILAGYSALHLIHFFTAGADEVKCWTVRAGSKAPKAAGVIHTDFEKGFIAAEVMMYNDFKEHGSSEATVKAAGRYLTKGKDYEVQDGDICLFRFNVSRGKK